MRAFLVALVLLLPVPAMADDAKRVNSLTVFDANNKRLGVVTLGGMSSPTVVFKTTAGQRYAVVVYQDRFRGSALLMYASADCSGPPLMLLDGRERTELILRTAVFPNGTVYLPDLAAGATQVATNSYRDFETGACGPDGYERSIVPTLPPINLGAKFTPPFRVE